MVSILCVHKHTIIDTEKVVRITFFLLKIYQTSINEDSLKKSIIYNEDIVVISHCMSCRKLVG